MLPVILISLSEFLSLSFLMSHLCLGLTSITVLLPFPNGRSFWNFYWKNFKKVAYRFHDLLDRRVNITVLPVIISFSGKSKGRQIKKPKTGENQLFHIPQSFVLHNLEKAMHERNYKTKKGI